MVEDTSLCFNAYKGLPGKELLPTCYVLCFFGLACFKLLSWYHQVRHKSSHAPVICYDSCKLGYENGAAFVTA